MGLTVGCSTMSNSPSDSTNESTVRKDLDDADRTDGFTVEHYSSDDVARACHAEEGQNHE